MLKQTDKVEKAYIWGAAEAGRRALHYCSVKFNIVGFIDKRADSGFHEFCSLPVMVPSQFFKGRDIEENINIIIAVKYPAEVMDLIMQHTDGRNIKLNIFDGRSIDNPLLYEAQDGEICVPEYMDKRFAEWGEYAEHYSKLNPFILEIFQTALAWIGEYHKGIKICELGCGSGQFANMLFDHGYMEYNGIDFSNQAIKLAKKANPSYADKFICDNVFSYLQNKCGRRENILFVAFEMLEHMGKDIELCNMLPDESVFIFSVPSFKSFNHVRTFQNPESIKSRYTMFNIVKYVSLPASINADKIYHLVTAIKK